MNLELFLFKIVLFFFFNQRQAFIAERMAEQKKKKKLSTGILFSAEGLSSSERLPGGKRDHLKEIPPARLVQKKKRCWIFNDPCVQVYLGLSICGLQSRRRETVY